MRPAALDGTATNAGGEIRLELAQGARPEEPGPRVVRAATTDVVRPRRNRPNERAPRVDRRVWAATGEEPRAGEAPRVGEAGELARLADLQLRDLQLSCKHAGRR
jgi:hypothetical protein